MENIIKTTLTGLFFGTFGTTLGGIIGIKIKHPTPKILSFILAIAAGLMISVVSFELIPESMVISGTFTTILGIIFGLLTMILCDLKVGKKFKNKESNSLLKTGVIISIGLAIHNIPEGLAIGTGFDSSIRLGYSLAIAIALHDIPEGISMAIPMKTGGISALKVIFLVFLSGITTGIGAFIGALIGSISKKIISISLAFAAGAMLYIVSGELTPEYNKLNNGKLSTIGNIFGFILGFLATRI